MAVLSAVRDFYEPLQFILYLLYQINQMPLTRGPGGWVEALGSMMWCLPGPGSPPGRLIWTTLRRLFILLEREGSHGSLLGLAGLLVRSWGRAFLS